MKNYKDYVPLLYSSASPSPQFSQKLPRETYRHRGKVVARFPNTPTYSTNTQTSRGGTHRPLSTLKVERLASESCTILYKQLPRVENELLKIFTVVILSIQTEYPLALQSLNLSTLCVHTLYQFK